MKLRDYQTDIVKRVYDSWNGGSINTCVQLSTGAGKTIILSKLISEHPGASIAIAHRNQLVGQLSLTLARFGIRHNIIAQKTTIREIVSIHHMELNKSYYDPNARHIVASVDTLVRLPLETSWFKQITLVVTDEGHHTLYKNKWGKARRLFPNARGLFPTATPIRADGNGLGRPADGLIDSLIVGPTMRELITAGYLTDYRIFAPPSDLDLSTVDITASGDFSPVRLNAAIEKSHITGDIVSHYVRIAPGKLGITFAVSIKAATEIAQEFRDNGVSAEVISSKTPELLRQQIMRRFRNREILQLVNVDILGEGVDVPAIEVISMGRPTHSYGLYVQQFGRALRPTEGKDKAVIIDHVGNVTRHGLPDAPRTWSLDRRERRARSVPDDVIPVKTCIKCLFVYTKYLKTCPNCGFYMPPSERGSPEQVEGDLLELDPDVLARLRGEADRIYDDIHPPKHLAPFIQRAILNKHIEKQQERAQLRNTIAQWAGYLKHTGADDSEIYRRFYATYGMDVLSAQALSKSATKVLHSQIVDNMSKSII